MGIKFRCPNGHKLNVKSFLAGKRGVCPKCGTSVRIPPASEPGPIAAEPSEPDDGDLFANAVAAALGNGSVTDPGHKGSNGSPRVAVATMPPMPASAPAPKPVVANHPVANLAAPSFPAPAAPSVRSATVPAMSAAPVAGMPLVAAPLARPAMPLAPPLTPPPGLGPADPLAEAPAATWYVRPPGGGQFGPARGEVMRKWVAEGRVSGDSLVWREGWTDWRNAAEIFPNLASASPAASTAAASAAAASAGLPNFPIPTSVPTHAASRSQARKKGGNGMAIALLAVLAIVCIGLVGVLVVVLATAS